MIENRGSTEKSEKKGQDGVKELIDEFEKKNKKEESKLRNIEIGRKKNEKEKTKKELSIGMKEWLGKTPRRRKEEENGSGQLSKLSHNFYDTTLGNESGNQNVLGDKKRGKILKNADPAAESLKGGAKNTSVEINKSLDVVFNSDLVTDYQTFV